MIELNKIFCHYPIGDWFVQDPPIDENTKTILLVRPGSRGDVLFAIPIIREVKKLWPDIKIDFMTLFPEMLNGCPHLNSIVPLKKYYRKARDGRIYDRVYFLSYEFTPEIHPVEAYGKKLNLNLDLDYTLDFYPSYENLEEANEYKIQCYGDTNVRMIILHKECGWKSRCWPDKHWTELEKLLTEYYPNHVIQYVGTKKAKNTKFRTAVNEDIRAIWAFMAHSDFIVCIDSGIMHMGVSLDKPVFSIFGITNPDLRLPKRYLRYAIQHTGITKGIHHTLKVPAEHEERKLINQACLDMERITPTQVMQKIIEYYRI